MKEIKGIIILLLGTALASCSTIDGADDDGTTKHYDLVFSVGNVGVTRMADDVVQADQPFRGLQGLLVIPFHTSGAVTATDEPLISTTTGSDVNKVSSTSRYYMAQCTMMAGTNRVLAYGKAALVSGKESAAQNGKLETTLTDRMLPSDITFSPSSIRNTPDVYPDAQELASYLTAIANTDGWSTTADAALKNLYLDFIHAESEGTGMMAGSAAHIKAYVKALRDQLKDNTDDLSIAIVANIDSDAKSCLDNGYPSAATSLGLPDGAAAIRWIPSESVFSVRTQTTTLDNINGITRYAYPAELWYYTNSDIRTSVSAVEATTYQSGDWDDVLDDNYSGGGTVNALTKAVAVTDPLQYAVARLQMTLSPISGTMKDAKNSTVADATAANLPLTGVLIGAQHTVGFDFKPVGEQSDVDAHFIYDPVVGTPAASGSWTVNTLVLQTYDGETVPVVLELANNTGHQFTGKDGVIYPGTKFYLIGQMDPAGKGADAYANRVFTQDYTTKVTLRVSSLKEAYSCMPDLLSPRLELGVQVTMQWEQSTPTTVKL